MSTDVNEILANATPEQEKFVLWRLVLRSDKAAAKKAGVHPSTASRWSNKAELDRAVNLLLREPIVAALKILEDAAPDAAAVLVAGLQSRNKMTAANSILDRVGLRGVQKLQHTGANDEPLKVVLTWGEDGRESDS